MRNLWNEIDTGWPKDDGLYACSLCGATVYADFKERHAAWHEKLRKAVDESDSLG